jgi:2-haloacid dehalogenase
MSTVTFDLFSALLDSRTGGAATLARLADERGWPHSGEELYDAWDRRNKRAQNDCRGWVPYRELAHAALAQTYAALGVDGDVDADLSTLLGSLPEWPLWPDVLDALPAISARHRVGILSNVDDALFAATRAAGLVDRALVVTSERVRAYKPDPRIYLGARELLGPLVHVATSGRDLRGALQAGVTVVRLRRPGHDLEADGPLPQHEAADLRGLADLLARVRPG